MIIFKCDETSAKTAVCASVSTGDSLQLSCRRNQYVVFTTNSLYVDHQPASALFTDSIGFCLLSEYLPKYNDLIIPNHIFKERCVFFFTAALNI